MAIAYAARTIIRGKCDFILAGGMEAPVTPYALLCCNTSGMLTENNDNPHTAYRPFDKNRDRPFARTTQPNNKGNARLSEQFHDEPDCA